MLTSGSEVEFAVRLHVQCAKLTLAQPFLTRLLLTGSPDQLHVFQTLTEPGQAPVGILSVLQLELQATDQL